MPSIKILLADDNEKFRSLLNSFLGARDGVEVIGQARDGLEAVKLATKLSPDLILMDLEMPVKDGFESTREIKRQVPKSRVVILSVYSSDVYRRAAREFGADGFIDKNNMKDALVALLNEEQARHAAAARVA
ncbi:MAG: response regulator transcription factor [Ignavibacteria bacterium]|nr:response regulator transcription factor [Ignavibacteria bacterium]